MSAAIDFSAPNALARLELEFTQAAEDVQRMRIKPTDIELLFLYGLYKIGTGLLEVTTPRPEGFLDVKAKSKWDMWNCLCVAGITMQQAQLMYINLVKYLISQYN
mmetsp:Transcript_12637/g.20588  ORF Transcript_12637/g.20588 Transcript_12637/m.20588 type:complete len:105 (-) Transcript_12637:184-498(-)|eukprot:CAMPEP_0184645080 /NCGR_PEP_ID=MMETSP0308-20130426/1636_1 /TAXON_ID=38269 /ORGANISM="Gloeochaete witrockiana, Strain SAG 46.84" /LENGTH=104 /DNA_ID=CAMNT_0027073895 /DNA_START=167 /DNA_END=481 /DNA_ORIENTATION=+